MAPVRSWIAFNAAALVLVVPPVLAQEREGVFHGMHMDYRTAREMVLEGRDYAVQAQTKDKEALRVDLGSSEDRIHPVLRKVLTDMNCAGLNDVGPKVGRIFNEDKTVTVRFAKLKEMSKTVPIKDGASGRILGHMVMVDESLPHHPRVLAIALAREAVRVRYAGFPDSQEKRQMEASYAARAFLELGGSRKKLPVIEPLTGYKNKEMAELVSAWEGSAGGDVKSLAELQRANAPRLARLEELEAERMDHDYRTHHPDPAIEAELEKFAGVREQAEAVEKALAAHKEFVAEESAWLWDNQFRLGQ